MHSLERFVGAARAGEEVEVTTRGRRGRPGQGQRAEQQHHRLAKTTSQGIAAQFGVC